MTNTAENNKRIAKNTLLLYFRMFLIMGVTLYTSRVILEALGVEDFGIYNVVAGVVVLFTFLNNAMASATQRYLTFALGKNDETEVHRIFSMSLTSHLIIAFIVIIAAETIGLWFVITQLNIPSSRMSAAIWAYQLAIITCCLQIIRVPYNASIIAYEKMSFYAWISIIETILKLLIVYVLLIYTGDNLIMYSLLLCLVVGIINLLYKFYCNKKYPITRYSFFWDYKLFKEFIGFSGWSLIGGLANVSAQQGLNLIINIFCGVTVNAAVGICNQVNTAICSFLTNFQTAFNPQLIKSYANNDRKYFMDLIFSTSKFSYFLMLFISAPILINCEFILKIWLDTVPIYTVEFTQLMIIFILFDAISGPLWISVQATGKIKNYQILMGGLILLNIPISFILLKLGLSPIYVFITRVILNAITLIARIVYLRPIIKLPVYHFMQQVIIRIVLVTIVSLPLPIWLSTIYKSWSGLFITTFTSITLTTIFIYVWGLSQNEKAAVKQFITKKLHKK